MRDSRAIVREPRQRRARVAEPLGDAAQQISAIQIGHFACSTFKRNARAETCPIVERSSVGVRTESGVGATGTTAAEHVDVP